MKLITTLFFLIGFICSAQSQYSVDVNELDKAKSRDANFLGIDEQGYIYASSFRTFNLILTRVVTEWIKVINPQNRSIVTEQKVDKKAISDRGYRYESFDFIEGRPAYIVSKKGEFEDKYYYALEVDRTLSLLGNPYKIGKKSNCSGFFSSGSKSFSEGVNYYKNEATGNRTFVSDITCKKDDELRFFAVKLNENNNVLFDFEFNLPLEGDIDKSNVFVSGNKIYFSIGVTRKERVEGRILRQNVTTNYLFSINEFAEVEEIDIDFGNNQVASEVSFSGSDGKVLMSGQIVNKTTNRLDGVFSATLDDRYNELSNLEKHLFDEEFITRFWSKYDKRRAEKGRKEAALVPNFILVDRYETDDGGAMFLYQKRIVRVVSRTTTTASGMMQYYSSTYYYYQDVIAVKMNSQGYLEWVELLPLDNLYVDYDPGPSFISTQKDGVLYVLHSASEKLIDQINSNKPETYSSGLNFFQARNPYIAVSTIDLGGNISASKLDIPSSNIHFSPRAIGVNQNENNFIMLSTPRNMFGVQKQTKIVQIGY